MAKVKRIINSGNTGAEQAALGAAFLQGVETGGSIPKGYVTCAGEQPKLKVFNLNEKNGGAKFNDCVKENIKDADGTVVFIKNIKEMGEPEVFAKEYCASTMKPLLTIPTDNFMSTNALRVFIEDNKIKTLHVTGRADGKDEKNAYTPIYKYMLQFLKER